MKGWLKLLVLGAIPILAVTMVADPAFAADKGSQLIFQSSMAHTNYISVVNAQPDGNAVTLLIQYYNNDMELALYYLRVVPGGSSVLVDPFDHMIPGTEMNTGDEIMGSGKMGNGHFVIAVTAVAAQVDVGDDPAVSNTAETANALFPTSLAEDLHGMGNIDACGDLKTAAGNAMEDADNGDNNLMLINPDEDGEIEACSDEDVTSANVADWGVGEAEVISFNHLTGHFTEALSGTDVGGPDQTLSWGGTPVVRPVVNNRDNDMMVNTDYQVLDGQPMEAYLAEKDAAGMGVNLTGDAVAAPVGYQEGTDNEAGDGLIATGPRTYRTIMADSGAMVLPSLSGVSGESTQIVQFLSVADEMGGPGKYSLIPAMTAIDVTLMDAMGNSLEMMSSEADSGIVGGGTEDPDEDMVSTTIIVNGINVMTNAGDCDGTPMEGPWKLSNLTSLVPEATAGYGDFTGLDDGGMEPMMNGSPGWIKFARGSLECEESYGDGDPGDLEAFEQPDGIPSVDDRTYTGGTLIVEEATSSRTFVTTGRAILKFVNPTSSFAASWTLKSPPSPDDTN